MNPNAESSARIVVLAVCVFLAAALQVRKQSGDPRSSPRLSDAGNRNHDCEPAKNNDSLSPLVANLV